MGCQYHSSESRGFSAGSQETGDISFELVQRISRELYELGTRELILTGEGEPLLHPKIIDIITVLKNQGFTLQLFTNGTLLNQKRAEELVASGVDTIKISHWANSPDEYKRLYPGTKPDNYEKINQGIAFLTNEKVKRGIKTPKVILSSPINQINRNSIAKKIELAHELKCDGIAVNPYKHWGGEFGDVALSQEELIEVTQELKKLKKQLNYYHLSHNIDDLIAQYKLGEKAWEKTPCYAGWYTTRIRSDGVVMPCCRCYIPLGDLNNDHLKDILNNSAYTKFRKKGTQKNGMTDLQDACACDWCIYILNNDSTKRMTRWLLPLLGKRIWK